MVAPGVIVVADGDRPRVRIDPVSHEYENRELPIPPVKKKKRKKRTPFTTTILEH
jgi:hypothetical protein